MKESISTPDLSCITDEDKDSVYEPAEDTFLLLDTLEEDCHLIRARKWVLSLQCERKTTYILVRVFGHLQIDLGFFTSSLIPLQVLILLPQQVRWGRWHWSNVRFLLALLKHLQKNLILNWVSIQWIFHQHNSCTYFIVHIVGTNDWIEQSIGLWRRNKFKGKCWVVLNCSQKRSFLY